VSNNRKGLKYWRLNYIKQKKNKADEFYTQLSDIEAEMRHYKEQFNGKVIFCNCDDPYESNFFKYFAMNFNYLGIKKLIATCYKESPVAGKQLSLFDVESLDEICSQEKHPYKIEITEVKDENADGAVDLTDVEYLLKFKKNTLKLLNGNGDFRSAECIELLKEADIVVTNPPFSLFREYIAQLIDYKKKFIILGNQNAITYKEVFKLIKEDLIWLGMDNGGTKWFQVPLNYEIKTESRKKFDDKGNKYFSMGNIMWFTNLDVSKRHIDITLYKHYTPEEYPHYENYEAINVNKVADIPVDWNGAMGVPVTFLDKYNPEQFKIIGLGISNSGIEVGVRPYKKEHKKYRKEIQKRGAVDGDLYMMKDGVVVVPYARILIKRIGAVQ
jgi:hypothetical protein